MSFRLKFWGVRGSIACPSPLNVEYGGNTSCLSLNLGDRLLILDSGTGIRNLGKEVLKSGATEAILLLTHTHWDHINGFPFFAPAFMKNFKLHIMAGHLKQHGGIQYVLANQMANPMFPVPLDAMLATMTFEDFDGGQSLNLWGEVPVKTAKLRHPDGATGYRIEYAGKSFCYVTDTEHKPGAPDQNVLSLIEGADLVVYDSTYTDAEFPAKVGWGHSTWQEGMRLCKAAKVKRFAIFHHDPDHDDTFMAALEEEARGQWSDILVARDNMEIVLA